MLMKTLAYLDCPTGIAGDMCLGALVHAGVPLAYLQAQLQQLGIQDEFQLRAESVQRNQQAATKVHVKLLRPNHLRKKHSHSHSHSHDHGHQHNHGHHDHTHDHTQSPHATHPHSHDAQSKSRANGGHSHDGRRLPDIETLIQQADLPARVVSWSLAIFRRLAKAEAAVHGIPAEQVHFHEVGATDAIVDIVGTCLGLDWLKVDALVCSPLPTGSGTVWCEHGRLPVPAPAVLNMMAETQMPVYDNGIAKELVTPTGCAIAATLAHSFGPPPRFTLQKIGLGAGTLSLSIPNILRLWIGTVEDLSIKAQPVAVSAPRALHEPEPHKPEPHEPEHSKTEPSKTEPYKTEPITELQTQLDDSSPQVIGYVFEQLFAAGAVDVFTQAVTMKKNRLGTLITVICPESAAAACEELLFRETTTLGIRRTQQQRSVLDRHIVKVTTAHGEVAVKVARNSAGSADPTSAGAVLNVHPEYEDCARLARSHNIPWQQVHHAAMVAAQHYSD